VLPYSIALKTQHGNSPPSPAVCYCCKEKPLVALLASGFYNHQDMIFKQSCFLVFAGQKQNPGLKEKANFGEWEIGVRNFLSRKFTIITIFANQHSCACFLVNRENPILKRLLPNPLTELMAENSIQQPVRLPFFGDMFHRL
jgi:hypothetical protein